MTAVLAKPQKFQCVITPRKLEDLIREKLPLGPASSTGFHPVRCAVCGDYKPRGGFKFDCGAVGYNCFNCGRAARYEEFSGRISRNMREILNAFGIDDADISAVVNSGFFKERDDSSEKITLSSLKKVSVITPPVKLPPRSIKLGSTDKFSAQQERIVEYLLGRRVDLSRYSFFFSLEPRFRDTVIIPFYRGGSLIFWQARAIVDGAKRRYDNSPGSRDAVMFNFDQLYSYSKTPLLVTEGVFDAMMFDGLAILGSKLSDAKIELLSRSPRRLIFVIDKDRNGGQLAKQALSHGWEITFAPDGARDVNESVQRFGLAWTALQLTRNIPADASAAQLAISMRCK